MPPQETNNNSPKNPEEGNAPRLRTFQGDMATMLEDNKVSMTTVLQAEEKRRRNTGEVATTGEEILTREAAKKRKKKIIIGGSALLILGIVLIILAFFLRSPKGQEVFTPDNLPVPSLIASDQSYTIKLSRKTHDEFIKTILARRRATTLSLGKVEELKFTNEEGLPLSSSDLFSTISNKLPVPFLRLLDPQYFFGLVQTGYRDTFIITKTTSFNTAWSGLLDWEPSMLTDLAESMVRLDSPAFKAVTNQGPPVTSAFTDELYENRDVRVLKDTSGNVVLIYSLIDRTTIIIANSQLAFKEALDRLRARSSIR